MEISSKGNYINICDLTLDEAELIQAAVLMLVSHTENKDHARILRRIAIQIDKTINK